MIANTPNHPTKRHYAYATSAKLGRVLQNW